MTARTDRRSRRVSRPGRMAAHLALAAAILAGAAGGAAADASRDKAGRDKAGRDKADRDKAGRDKADRDKADRDKADRDKADQLFAEGRALLASNLIEACDKFTLSLRYNREAIGTLLNVAICDEKLGHLASALARYIEVRDRAKEQGLLDHQRAAERRIADVAPSVPHLAIRLTQPVPEAKVTIDERLIPIATLDDVTVDPGDRVIVISAPGLMPYRATLTIARAEHRTLTVPPLAPAVTQARSLRRIGVISTLAGGTAFVTSIGLALYGRHLHNQQLDSKACSEVGGEIRCSGEGQAANDRARTYGTVATWVGGIGMAAAVGGAYLWFRAVRADHADPQIAIVPALDAHGAGIVAAGRF